MRIVRLVGDNWDSGDVLVADSFAQRLHGLRNESGSVSMLIRGRSVHGRGMGRHLWAVGLDRSSRVIAVRRLAPGGIVFIPRAAHILEIPIESCLPPVGSSLSIVASCREHLSSAPLPSETSVMYRRGWRRR